MPNWIHCSLEIVGEPSELYAFREKACGAEPHYGSNDAPSVVPLSFHQFLPVPAELLQRSYGGEDEEEEARRNGLPCDPESPDHCGYNWERAHWGVKWGACDATLERAEPTLIYHLHTAWDPPVRFFIAVSEQFPGLTFELSWASGEAGCAGRATVHRGELTQLKMWDPFDPPEEELPPGYIEERAAEQREGDGEREVHRQAKLAELRPLGSVWVKFYEVLPSLNEDEDEPVDMVSGDGTSAQE